MDHIGRVSRFEGIGNLGCELGHLRVVVLGQLALFANLFQGMPQIAGILDQLHRDPMQAIGLTGAKDRDDAGMRQSSPGARFTGEEVQALLIHALGQQQFQGDLAPETVLLRFPDLAHATAAETLDQGEVA